jgi:HK97 family phage portal protein
VSIAGKAYIHLGYPTPYTVSPGRDVVYASPWFDDLRSVTGKTVTQANAYTFIPFFAGVRLISNTVGRLPLVLYHRIDDDERERAPDKQLYGMLHDEPNPEMSAMTARSAMQGHVVTWGNAYAERERDDLGRDRYLWPLRPDRMQVLLDTTTGRKFYRYRVEPMGDEVDLRADQVFHVPGFGFDGRVGYSILSLARDALGIGLSAQEFAGKFYTNGASFPGIVTYPKQYSDRGRTDLEAAFRGRGGLTKAHRVAIVEEGVNWTQVGMPLNDAQFLETRKFQRSEMATLLNIPPHMLQDVERSTSWGTGIEEQTLTFMTFSVGDWTDLWQAETNRQLVRPAYGRTHYAEFLIEALLKMRAEDQTRNFRGLWEMGVLTDETIAKKLNLPSPEKQTGRRYHPANFTEVGDAGVAEPADGEQPVPSNVTRFPLALRAALAQMPTAEDIAREMLRLQGPGRRDAAQGGE